MIVELKLKNFKKLSTLFEIWLGRKDSNLRMPESKSGALTNLATPQKLIRLITHQIMDDMVDTANTLCQAAAALKRNGARKVLAYCTHPVLSGKAIERITSSEIDELVVTDTIPLTEESRGCDKIRQLSIANLFAETISRISNEDSVSSLFID